MQDPVKHKLRTVNYAGIAGVLLLVVGTLALGVYPMYQDGQEKILARAKTQAACSRIESLRGEVEKVAKELQASQQRLTDAEKNIPSGAPDYRLNQELTDVARAAGIRVESTPPLGAPQSDGAYKAVAVSVDGTGDWESCMRFLRGISAMRRISRLDTVTLDTDRDGLGPGGSPVCHIMVKFSTFYRE